MGYVDMGGGTYGGLGADMGPPTLMQVSLSFQYQLPRLQRTFPKVAAAGAAAPTRMVAAETRVAKCIFNKRK